MDVELARAEEERQEEVKRLEAAKDEELSKVRAEAEAEKARAERERAQAALLGAELAGVESLERERAREMAMTEQEENARKAAEGAFNHERSVVGRRNALSRAQRERHKAELAFAQAEQARTQAEQALMEAQRRAAECVDELRAEELAREANERTMMLLPGLQELLGPTQKQLKQTLDSVATAVMRNVEESARMLAKVATQQADQRILEQRRKKEAREAGAGGANQGSGAFGGVGAGVERERLARGMMDTFRAEQAELRTRREGHELRHVELLTPAHTTAQQAYGIPAAPRSARVARPPLSSARASGPLSARSGNAPMPSSRRQSPRPPLSMQPPPPSSPQSCYSSNRHGDSHAKPSMPERIRRTTQSASSDRGPSLHAAPAALPVGEPEDNGHGAGEAASAQDNGHGARAGGGETPMASDLAPPASRPTGVGRLDATAHGALFQGKYRPPKHARSAPRMRSVGRAPASGGGGEKAGARGGGEKIPRPPTQPRAMGGGNARATRGVTCAPRGSSRGSSRGSRAAVAASDGGIGADGADGSNGADGPPTRRANVACASGQRSPGGYTGFAPSATASLLSSGAAADGTVLGEAHRIVSEQHAALQIKLRQVGRQMDDAVVPEHLRHAVPISPRAGMGVNFASQFMPPTLRIAERTEAARGDHLRRYEAARQAREAASARMYHLSNRSGGSGRGGGEWVNEAWGNEPWGNKGADPDWLELDLRMSSAAVEPIERPIGLTRGAITPRDLLGARLQGAARHE